MTTKKESSVSTHSTPKEYVYMFVHLSYHTSRNNSNIYYKRSLNTMNNNNNNNNNNMNINTENFYIADKITNLSKINLDYMNSLADLAEAYKNGDESSAVKLAYETSRVIPFLVELQWQIIAEINNLEF